MATLLRKVKSSSGNSVHKIIKGDDGINYCTCFAWKYNGICKHLRDYQDTRNIFDNIEPGDHVEIINPGGQYTSYDEFMYWAGIKKNYKKIQTEGTRGVVLYSDFHNFEDKTGNPMLIVETSNSNVFVINVDSVCIVKKAERTLNNMETKDEEEPLIIDFSWNKEKIMEIIEKRRNNVRASKKSRRANSTASV